MEQSETSGFERFARGFITSAGSGALMMGIYYGLTFLAGLLKISAFATIAANMTLASVLGPAALVTTAVALFGGVMAVIRGDGETPTPQLQDMRNTEVSIAASRGLAPTPALQQAAAPAPVLLADATPAPQPATQPRWTDRPNIAQANRSSIASILADGASDKSHAQSILAAQQQANLTSLNPG